MQRLKLVLWFTCLVAICQAPIASAQDSVADAHQASEPGYDEPVMIGHDVLHAEDRRAEREAKREAKRAEREVKRKEKRTEREARREAKRAEREAKREAKRTRRKIRNNKYSEKRDGNNGEVEQSVAVVLVDMQNGQSALTRETAEERIWGETDSVKDIFRINSLGKLHLNSDLDGDGIHDIFGPFYVDQPVESACANSRFGIFSWYQSLGETIQANGIDIEQYDHVYYVFPPNINCAWAGTSYGGPGTMQIKVASIFVLAHELGHNLGLRHVGLDPANDGILDVPIGDGSALMGSPRNRNIILAAPNFEQLGFIEQSEGALLELEHKPGVHSISLAPLSVDPQSTPLPQIVELWKIKPSLKYFLSFRNDHSYDANVEDSYKTGLSIHWAARIGGFGGISAFVKTLSDGEIFSDPQSGLTIEQIGKHASGDQVDIRLTMSEPVGIRPISLVAAPFKTPQNHVRPNEPAKYWVRLRNNDLPSEQPSQFRFSLVDYTEYGYGFTPTTTYEYSQNDVILAPGEEITVELSIHQDGTEDRWYLFDVVVDEINPFDPDVVHTQQTSYQYFKLSYEDPLPVTNEGPRPVPSLPSLPYYLEEITEPATNLQAQVVWENKEPVEVIITFDESKSAEREGGDVVYRLWENEFPAPRLLSSRLLEGNTAIIDLRSDYPNWYRDDEIHRFSIGSEDQNGSRLNTLSDPIAIKLTKTKKNKQPKK